MRIKGWRVYILSDGGKELSQPAWQRVYCSLASGWGSQHRGLPLFCAASGLTLGGPASLHDYYAIFLQFSFRKSFLVHADCITPRGSFFDRIMLLCFLPGCNVRVQKVICWPGWLWKYVTPVVPEPPAQVGPGLGGSCLCSRSLDILNGFPFTL